MNKLLIFFVFLTLVASNCFSQEIEYDFKNPNTFLGNIPYDQSFSFHFINIDSPRVKSITVSIYQVDITDYQKILRYKKYIKGDTTKLFVLTNDDILKFGMTPVIMLHTKDSVLKKAVDLPCYLTLKPNERYFIEIIRNSHEKLSENKKKELYENFITDILISSLINQIAQEQINNPKTTFDSFRNISKEIIKRSRIIIEETNQNYLLPYIDSFELIDSLGNSFLNLNNFIANIKNDYTLFQKSIPESKKTIDTSKLFNLKKEIFDKLKKANWVELYDNNKEVGVIDSLTEEYIAKIREFGLKSLNEENGKEDSLLKKTLHDALVATKESLFISINSLIIDRIYIENIIATTYPKEFVIQAGQFITSKLGLAYVWGIGRVNPYIAIHISPSALQDSIPLRQFKGFGGFIRSRFSFMIGMSLDGIAKDSVRRGIILGNQALILGGSFRIWTWFNINSGFYMYYQEPTNPLLNREQLTFTGSPFVSLSIDIRVQSLLNGVGNAIFKTPLSQ